jgi:hypothetical protein
LLTLIALCAGGAVAALALAADGQTEAYLGTSLGFMGLAVIFCVLDWLMWTVLSFWAARIRGDQGQAESVRHAGPR